MKFSVIAEARIGLSTRMQRVISDLEEAMVNTAYRLIVKGLWLELLGRLHESSTVTVKSGKDSIVRRIGFTIEKMHAEPGRGWQKKELADMVGWTPNHYSMRFRQIVRRSPMDYLIHHRLERASQLLSSTMLNISEVADQVGFNSMSYFARCFKHTYGYTPKTFREVREDRNTW